MSDFGTMVTRIGSEMHRTATADETKIKDAIVTAIERYKYERFWFNEDWMEFTTTSGTDDYVDGDFTLDDGSTNLPLADILKIDDLVYNVGTNWRYGLTKMAWQWVEDEKTVTTTQGFPEYWTFGYQRIRLQPIPNRTGDKVEGKIIRDFNTITAASADATTNAWMVEAEELIRLSATRDLYLTHFHSASGASRAASLELEAFRKLRKGTEMFISDDLGVVPRY